MALPHMDSPRVVERVGGQQAEQDTARATRFDALFRRFYPQLFGLVYRYLSDSGETEDTLQEAFLKLAHASVRDEPEPAVGAWLRQVCVHLAMNRLRQTRRSQARLEHVGRLEQAGSEADDDGAGAAHAVLQQEQRERVRTALKELPERQRACLVLRYSGYSYAEIASTLGIATGSVGVLLARGERAFRVSYQRDNGDAGGEEL